MSETTSAIHAEEPSSHLHVEKVAEHLGCSVRTVHELTRRHRIPHWKKSDLRRVYYPVPWLRDWENGAELETQELPDGGRIVRPRTKKAA